MYGERLSCVCQSKGWRDSCYGFFISSPPLQSADRPYLACVEPSPCTADSESALAGRIGLPHPVSPCDLAAPYPQVAHGRPLPRQPVPPCAFLGLSSLGQEAALSLHDPYAACTFQGRLLVEGHWCQHELQCHLGGSLGSAGLQLASL